MRELPRPTGDLINDLINTKLGPGFAHRAHPRPTCPKINSGERLTAKQAIPIMAATELKGSNPLTWAIPHRPC